MNDLRSRLPKLLIRTGFRRLWAVMASLLLAMGALAQISPGDLSRFHATLEGLDNCTACHELRKEVSAANCLACHALLRSQVSAGKGYHASSDVRNRNCRECHSEHNGRDYELVHWPSGQRTFYHAVVGFKLSGAHAKQECRDCHNTRFLRGDLLAGDKSINRERTFLALTQACVSCHEDEHREQLTDNCADCHDFDAWSPATKYEHSRSKYPLAGRHQQVACDKCHALESAPPGDATRIQKKNRIGMVARYGGLAFANCSDCHRDPHEGKLGTSCSTCHVTEGFTAVTRGKFDHSKTHFPLAGKHQTVRCDKCHKSERMTDPLTCEKCADCHRDTHYGQFKRRASGGACEECHTVNRFKPADFDVSRHDSTRYPLTGGHLAVPCVACHAVRETPQGSYARFAYDSLNCQTCHSDAHKGQLDHWIKQKGCEFCHTTESWHRTSFDHKLSRFPLEGKHREIVCLKCHTVKQSDTGQETMWMKPLAMECAGCHKDIHKEQFTRRELNETQTLCTRCHTPEDWKSLVFVHNRDSRFPLDGAHARVACAACHKARTDVAEQTVVYRPLGMACSDCHATQR